MRDPYSILGVAKSADAAAIKSAYRKLAKTYHPDQNPDDPKAKERFAEISAAYDIVGDADRRGQFDRGEIDAAGQPTMAGFNPFGGNGRGRAQGGANPGFEDIFAQFAQGAGAGGGARGFRSQGFPGGGASAEDILKNMFGGAGPGFGADMGGAGAQARAKPRPSKGADRRVEASISLEELLAGDKVTVTFPGQGSVKVALPKGAEDGQTIRLKGKGDPSPAPGGQAGDALVTLRLADHPVFKTDGATLSMDLPVTLDEAVLGARVSVTTLDGTVAMTLPEGTQSGRVMRLKGRGLPTKSGARGDLLVKVLIKLPEDGDEALAALMRRWRADGRYQVR
ncbi:MAG: J domain-containing protein [Pseudomonadota bacterium]